MTMHLVAKYFTICADARVTLTLDFKFMAPIFSVAPTEPHTMPLIRLLHAFATGAASFSLTPVLPYVQGEVLLKSSSESFAADAMKLAGDYKRALVTVSKEVESSGKSITTQT